MMRYFQDLNGKVHAFEDDVAVIENANIYSFATASGAPLETPANLTPCANNQPPVETLAQTQAIQGEAVRAACTAAIMGCFTSLALGVSYTYGSKINDQHNINFAAIYGGSLWCADTSGKWSLTVHTADQAKQVQADLWSHIQVFQAKHTSLLAEISAATTVGVARSIVW